MTGGSGRGTVPAVLLDRLPAVPVAAGRRSFVVGLDGRSGSGKSTLAAAVATRLGGPAVVTVIEGDDFYRGGSARTWDRRSAPESVDRVTDWRAQRSVLTRLRAGGAASWHAFDWDDERWDDDRAPVATTATTARAAPVVVLEGAYACRPELHDLLDLRVLLTAPGDVRRRRLATRDGDDHDPVWEARWAAAETHYLDGVMPPERFDVVLG
ncbi:uridine kinase family protein [Pseudonocardia spirodelae]|uniref:Phosphoribulokinase/uridine kinase domain-containing protein n=1 Tax=Pseudonocardia spirodelae TaxID=3133431 RepID=A0ABU8TEB9_9PSEU